MSRKATKEYIKLKRRQYAETPDDQKTRFLNEVMDVTALSRKYVTNLLNGKITYRGRKGRGKTYGAATTKVLAAVWYEAGCPCAPYFKACIGMWVEEFEQYVANVAPRTKDKLLKMSASSMERALKGLARIKPGYAKTNKRSGRNNELKRLIPCHSGEEVMACRVPPGDVQIDTFAMGGGDPSDNFFWILTETDRKTQWTVLSPTWNRGQHATLEAMKRIDRKFPFEIRSLHCDNGGEVINHHVAAYLGKERPGIYLSRSRPRHSNDNAHVEEKNKSVGRELLGERRLDRPDLETDLVRLCEEWSDFCNFFRPTKMLLAKVKREDGKGFRCVYDDPKTPCQRVLDEHVLSPEKESALTAMRDSLHPIELRRRIIRRLNKIVRLQDEYNEAKKSHDEDFLESALEDSALRAAPSGSSSPGALQVGGASLLPRPPSKKRQRQLSTEYLTNRKRPAYLVGTLSI